MNNFEKIIFKKALENISNDDISHDFDHSLRVLNNAYRIHSIEGGDMNILFPAALFHDLVKLPKRNSEYDLSQSQSAVETELLLRPLELFTEVQLDHIKKCIIECSFTKNIEPSSLESEILQDSDLLDSSGAIAVMRTFASAGQIKNKFYNRKDPFCKSRLPNDNEYALDLFFTRLTKIDSRLNTETAKIMNKNRADFITFFLKEIKEEMWDNCIFLE